MQAILTKYIQHIENASNINKILKMQAILTKYIQHIENASNINKIYILGD